MPPRYATRRWGLRAAVALIALGPLLTLAVLFAAWGQPEPAIWAHLRAHLLVGIVANTLWLSLGVAIGVSVLGLGLAWLVSRYDFPGRAAFEMLLALPLAVPAYVAAFVYVGFLEYSGPVAGTLRAIGLDAPNPRGLVGASVLLSLVLYPYVYLLARAALRAQGARAFEAARTLGEGPLGAFRRAALPLIRPAWIAGLALALMETLADFGAVSLLGVDTFTTAIYRTWFGLYSLPAAAQLATVFLLFIALALVLERLSRRGARFAMQQTAPLLRVPLRGGRALLAATLCMLVVLGALALPLWQLASWALSAPWNGGTLWPLIGNTLAIAAACAALVVMLGLALALVERSARGDAWLRVPGFVATLGYAVPGTVLAVGIMLVLLHLDRGLAGLGTGTLAGSIAGVLAALSIRFLRLGHSACESALEQLRPSVIEAARTLGAGARDRLWRVYLPTLRPALFTGALLVAVEAMKELPATLMLRPFGWDTLAVRIYAYTAEGLWHEAAIPALLLVAVGMVPVWVLMRRS
ncbi:MAG TPA: iron ABC transporter permease [Xanthomonadaceae bacterium]|nr:iron ABC transporter permease [Xanthomonadaceae bacterium]